MDIDLLPLEAVCEEPTHFRFSDWQAQQRSIASARESTYKMLASAIAAQVSNGAARSFQDHLATYAHHMGMEPAKPAPVVAADAPKAKPALAGLGIVAGERVGGIGFCDA